MATITTRIGKNEKKSWQVRYRLEEKQFTKSFPTEKEAKKFKKGIESQIHLGIAFEESNLTFENYSNEFVKRHTIEMSVQTKLTYKYQLGLINRVLGKKKLKDITPNIIDNYLMGLKEDGLGGFGINKKKSIINLILNSAFKKGLIPFNPMIKTDFQISNKAIKEKKLITSDELKTFYRESETFPFYVFFAKIGIMTGFRRGEILGLKLDKIDFKKKTITIDEQFTPLGSFDKTKFGKTRIFHMYDSLFEVIQEIVEWNNRNKRLFGNSYNDNKLLICREDGSPVTTTSLRHHFDKINDKFDVYITPHMFRHTFISTMAKKGANVKDLQLLAGHSRYETTMNIYTHHIKYQDETIDKMNELKDFVM